MNKSIKAFDKTDSMPGCARLGWNCTSELSRKLLAAREFGFVPVDSIRRAVPTVRRDGTLSFLNKPGSRAPSHYKIYELQRDVRKSYTMLTFFCTPCRKRFCRWLILRKLSCRRDGKKREMLEIWKVVVRLKAHLKLAIVWINGRKRGFVNVFN